MALNGNIIIVQLNGNTIAGTKTTEIQVDIELIEIASATQGQYREYITGRKQWQVTVNYLLMSAGTTFPNRPDAHLCDPLFVGNSYTLRFMNRYNQGYHQTDRYVGLTGTAILSTCKITATRGNLIQGTFTFVGTSGLAPMSA
jgi:hypothetical protein